VQENFRYSYSTPAIRYSQKALIFPVKMIPVNLIGTLARAKIPNMRYTVSELHITFLDGKSPIRPTNYSFMWQCQQKMGAKYFGVAQRDSQHGAKHSIVSGSNRVTHNHPYIAGTTMLKKMECPNCIEETWESETCLRTSYYPWGPERPNIYAVMQWHISAVKMISKEAIWKTRENKWEQIV